nr:FtsQ-type POTRA domain-containing protein [Adlercreutzia sp. ZJ473]
MDRLERDHARAERTKRAAQASRRPLIVVGVIAALVLVLAVAWFALARTSAFAIENVEVTGADHLTTSEVSQLVSIPQGTTLLTVDTDAIKSSLERDSWVESVSVSREFPSTLKVAVTERQVAAVVEVPMGSTQTIQDWAIASDGMWLMAIPSRDSEVGRTLSPKIYEDAESVLRITGVPYGLAPEIGAYCTDDNVNNALSIVDGMTTELADQVKKVTATDPASTLLTLENGVEIAFGTADDIREKERVVLAIMEENPTVVYINVRVVDRPTWRAA